MGDTKIQWADKVWNPITGCTPVSAGCERCYASRMSKRLRGRYGYPADDPFRVTHHPDRIKEPLKIKKPKRIFVCSMGDLFHKDVSYGFIDKVWGIMSVAPRHTFLILTKRPELMLKTISRLKERHCARDSSRWPLPNVHLGVSVENQATADERIPLLLQTPAAKRFVSIEPMLGAVDLTKVIAEDADVTWQLDVLTGEAVVLNSMYIEHCQGPKLDQVILGGESGPGARPMHPDWPRKVRDQCEAARVPFFFKQWGEWGPSPAKPIRGKYTGGGIFLRPDGVWGCQGDWWDGKAAAMDKVGKKTAGHLLDGKEYREL